MKQKFLAISAFIFLFVVLVGLNAASYVRQEEVPDSELFPNRSSYNAGATGTRVFYELLNETGRKVVRWQEPPKNLLGNKNAPQVFVLIGPIRREFSEIETRDILQWTAAGGKLVIIDREPPRDLVTSTADWSISISGDGEPPMSGVDPADTAQITDKVPAAKPVQPTVYTKSINAVQPSKLFSAIVFERFFDDNDDFDEPQITAEKEAPDSDVRGNTAEDDEELTAAPNPIPPPPVIAPPAAPSDQAANTLALSAPVVHLSSGDKNILVDVPYGSGRIVFLTDPFIVSNAGINLVDNAPLGVNITASNGGLIAFDEYHHGYGTNNNRLLQYFAGTPVIAIFLQIVLLAGLILFSQSRRFARAIPGNEPNRLTKLEYVAAMAELQRRTKSYDLAIENIYTDFRRRAARAVGADVFTVSTEELAKMIGERAEIDAAEIAALLRQCEEITRGAAVSKKEALRIAQSLRQVEEKLGLVRSKKVNT